MNSTEQIIEDLLAVSSTSNTREKHLLRESLRNLVRLAKAEQMLEMRMDLAKVAYPAHHHAPSPFLARQ